MFMYSTETRVNNLLTKDVKTVSKMHCKDIGFITEMLKYASGTHDNSSQVKEKLMELISYLYKHSTLCSKTLGFLTATMAELKLIGQVMNTTIPDTKHNFVKRTSKTIKPMSNSYSSVKSRYLNFKPKNTQTKVYLKKGTRNKMVMQNTLPTFKVVAKSRLSEYRKSTKVAKA